MEFGLVVIFFGFLFLIKNIGIIPAEVLDWSIVWPVFVILCGLVFISRGHRHHKKCHPCKGDACGDCVKKA